MKFIKIIVAISILLSGVGYSNENVNINFRNLEISDFIQMVSKITKKNILIDADITGKVNFISAKPVKKSDLMPLANSILLGKGLTIIDQGDYYKVVRLSQAAGEGVGLSGGKKSTGLMKTKIFRLKNSNADDVSSKIRPLLHQDAQVIAFKDSNILSVTALPQSLKSIQSYINSIESRGARKPAFVKLHNVKVKDVYENIVNISKDMFPENIPTQRVQVLKDEADNRLILVGESQNVNQLIPYIKRFDIANEASSKQMYTIQLENSDVVEMEKILSPILAGMNSMERASVSATVPTASAISTSSTSPITPVTNTSKGSQGTLVVADVERNALIVLATPSQINNIRSTIYSIDRPKAQVYVKVKIVEINNNIAKQIGLRYGFEGGKITSRGLLSAAANIGAPSLMISNNLLGFLNSSSSKYDANGNVITSTSRPFSFASNISEVFALGAKIDLLEKNGAAHILSEPSILCTNNKEANIYVGQTQSILTQAQQSITGQANIINNYSREDIGITLKIKPRLSSNNKVALDVEIQIEDILPGAGSSDRPTTTKRKIKTNTIAQNGETVVLGGLIKSSGGKTYTKVPLLGDIPLLGALFRSKGDAQSSVNVIVYLTPYIVKDSYDMNKLKDALSELEEVQEKYNNYVYEGLKMGASKTIEPKEINASTKPTKVEDTFDIEMLPNEKAKGIKFK